MVDEEQEQKPAAGTEHDKLHDANAGFEEDQVNEETQEEIQEGKAMADAGEEDQLDSEEAQEEGAIADAGLDGKDESAIGKHRFSETNIVHATESQIIASQNIVFSCKETGQLSGTFAQNHTRHKWESRHVTGRPEFLVGDVFITHNALLFPVDMDDGG